MGYEDISTLQLTVDRITPIVLPPAVHSMQRHLRCRAAIITSIILMFFAAAVLFILRYVIPT
jgi:hypothetical protein